MDVERYRALLCAIDTGSLSAAAEKLQYTPSGVSRMIAALEEENGFPLLVRERSGVRPTADCLRLLPAIRELLHAARRCQQLSARIRGMETGTVTVGTAYSAYYTWLAKVTAAFHRTYPGIQVELRGGSSAQLLKQLEGRQLDLCFISRREGGHDWLPICRDPMMGWVPAGHPLAAGASLPVAAFETESCIETYPGTDIDNARVFRRCGVHPNIRFSTRDSYATYAMVEAGLGISMNNALNGLALSGTVRILPLDPPQTVEIGVASLPDAAPAARRFLEFLPPYFDELAQLSQPKA